MIEAKAEATEYSSSAVVTREQIELIADRVFAIGISDITTISGRDRETLVTASRCLRRLLSAFENSTQRQLNCILIAAGRR